MSENEWSKIIKKFKKKVTHLLLVLKLDNTHLVFLNLIMHNNDEPHVNLDEISQSKIRRNELEHNGHTEKIIK